ncbi:unnamed protein product [Linum tenue]|uniref:Chaperonin-like RbcX protein 2, chloroplastic n=1 Tax=Linum tenue TaxID=586396 RepID=A0AAV0JV81_9ROSI|nr:unnamed protein product [Linum tenue]
MVGGAAAALPMVGSSVVLDSLPDLVIPRSSSMKKKQQLAGRSVELGSSFAISGICSRSKGMARKQQQRKDQRRLVIVAELGGQYEDTFNDVKTQIMNYFTYKAVRTVMNQLYEMNPTHYRWFYDFVVMNKPGTGKHFIRTLAKERQDLAERVMVTRLHLYGKWIKKCNHAEMYQEISDENLALMRERLLETVIWPSDDTNTEKIG